MWAANPMNEQSLSPPADAPARDGSVTNRLLLFFALVYVVEGVGQVGGLIAQPLSFPKKRLSAPLAEGQSRRPWRADASCR
jgi:hypothetical protein